MVLSHFLIKGRIDGAYFNGEDWVVYDYKAQVNPDNEASYMHQMTMYMGLLAQHVPPWDSGVVRGVLYDCHSGRATDYVMNMSDCQALYRQIKESLDNTLITLPLGAY